MVDSSQLDREAPRLSRESLAHLRVLRPKEGEVIELFDGRGRWRTFLFRRDRGEAFPLEASDTDVHYAKPPASLTLFACVTKGSRWDWTIEKATELGVTRIVPVISARTIVRIDPGDRVAKRERWTRIAEDAARQSDAKWIPEIHEPVSFDESLSLVRETTCFVGALTTPQPPMIAAALASPAPSSAPTPVLPPYSLYVGPEGDFTPEELAALVAIANPVSFGSTILRAETAAVYGLSVLKSRLDVSGSTGGATLPTANH